MIITEIKRKGKSELYHVYLDGEYFGLLQAEYIYKNKLKTGTEIEKEQIEKVKEESDRLTCSSMALNYVAKMIKSEKQVKDYLKKHGFSSVAIAEATQKLKQYGYINDEQFAEFMLNSLKNKKGKNAIKQDLMQKGIKKEQIDEVLDNLSGQEETCQKIAQKWLKAKPLPLDNNNKAKLYRHLASKGFEFDVIKETLNKVEVGGEDDWY